MKNLRMLSVTFAEEIQPNELENFRGALIEKVGLEHERYHNHNNAKDGSPAFHYRYPLVQYQLLRRRPRLLFLEEAIEDARHFFTRPDWDFTMNGRPYQSTVAELKASQYEIGLTPGQYRHYRLRRWQALNTDNFQSYRQLETLTAKVAFLERVLTGQLLSFFSGVGHRLPERFGLALTDWHYSGAALYKGVRVCTFGLSFRTDLLLPPGVGLGKGVSLGFGMVGRGGENLKMVKYKA